MVGQPTHRGDRVAYFRARSGPSLVDTILGPLLPEFHDFYDRILFCYHGVLSPHTCFLFIFMHNMWRQTYIQKEIESM